MGIYSDGKVYGVLLMLDTTVFVRLTSIVELSPAEIEEVKIQYQLLTEDEKNTVGISFYTACTTTCESTSTTMMSWFPGTRDLLESFLHL